MEKIKNKDLMDYLLYGLEDDGISKKFERSKTFTPVYLARIQDFIVQGKIIKQYYMVHYSIQNSDMMADPEVNIIKMDGEYYAYMFRNDYIGKYDIAILLENNKLQFYPKLQSSIANFVNEIWMPNIKNQQNISANEITNFLNNSFTSPEIDQILKDRAEMY